MLWTNGVGTIYSGDCQPGDRSATDAEIAAYNARVIVPASVPMWAAQAALKLAGKYDAINTTIAGWATSADKTQVAVFFAWTMGNDALRTSPFITTLASQFGFAAADLDTLFVSAGEIAATAG